MIAAVDFDPNKELQMIAVIEFGSWLFRTTIEQPVTIGHGWTHWFDQALTRIYDTLPVNRHDAVHFTLTDADGNTLLCEDDEQGHEEWLRDLVVSATLRPAAFDVHEEREQARAG